MPNTVFRNIMYPICLVKSYCEAKNDLARTTTKDIAMSKKFSKILKTMVKHCRDKKHKPSFKNRDYTKWGVNVEKVIRNSKIKLNTLCR